MLKLHYDVYQQLCQVEYLIRWIWDASTSTLLQTYGNDKIFIHYSEYLFVRANAEKTKTRRLRVCRSALIVFQRWLRKFCFQHLIFFIFLCFRAGFWNILNFSFWSFFEVRIFKIHLLTLQNHFWNPSGSILKTCGVRLKTQAERGAKHSFLLRTWQTLKFEGTKSSF